MPQYQRKSKEELYLHLRHDHDYQRLLRAQSRGAKRKLGDQDLGEGAVQAMAAAHLDDRDRKV